MVFKSIKKFFLNFYNLYLTGLTILISLPILAPLFLHLGLIQVAKVIYFIYSFFCHQFAYRSIHLYDFQFAWCARDTGIWIGIWITALLIKFNKVKGIKWYWVFPFMIPIALDGGIQTVFTILNVSSQGVLTGLPLYMSTNLTRFMTGAVFGIGLSLWLSPMLKAEGEGGRFAEETKFIKDEDNSKSKRLTFLSKSSPFLKSQPFKILSLCFLMFPIYLVLFTLWNSTSEVNKPIPPLDFVVKAPQQDFLTRREDAICPTNGFEDLFAFDCFLGKTSD